MAITRVQSTTATTGATNASTLSVVFGATPTKGNIIVIALMNSGAGSIATVRANTNAHITWLVCCSINGTGGTCNLIVGRVIDTSASATIGLTADATRPLAAVAVEYSGLNIADDLQTFGTGNSTVVLPTALGNVNFNNELVIVAGGLQGQWSSTGANPFTVGSLGAIVAQINTNNNTAGADRAAFITEYFTTATVGNPAGTPSASCATGQWAAVAMTFNQNLAGGGLRTAGHGGLAA